MKTDRRKTDAHGQMASDRLTKQLIVWTVCSIALLLTMTLCRMAVNSMDVPDALDRLANLAIGAIIGFIGKTSVDYVTASNPVPPNESQPTPVVVTNEPANPVPTTEEAQPVEEQPVEESPADA